MPMNSTERTLLGSFEMDGRWGLPGQEADEWIPGRATYSPVDGIRLSTERIFKGNSPGSAGPIEHDVIVGTTRQAEYVTLVYCQSRLGEMHFRRTGSSITGAYRAGFMVIGEHLSSPAEFKYDALLVSFHDLAEFVGLTGFEQKSGSAKITLRWARPPVLSATLGDYTVRTAYSLRTSGSAFSGDQQMAERAWFELKRATRFPVEEAYAGPIASLRYLAQLSVGHQLPIVSLCGEKVVTSRGRRGSMDQFAIFFEEKRSLPLPEQVPPLRLLFTLQELGKDLAKCLACWHEGFTLFRDALDWYFSLDPRADRAVAIEHHFMSMINAFETYHRRKGTTRYELDPAKHQERLERIINAASAEDKPWLLGKLQFSNEVTLRSRVRELFAQAPSPLRKACGERKRFVNSVVMTRHYLTHHDDKIKSHTLSGASLWAATEKLRILLVCAFCRQLALSDDKIVAAFRRSPNFFWLLSRTRLLYRASAAAGGHQ